MTTFFDCLVSDFQPVTKPAVSKVTSNTSSLRRRKTRRSKRMKKGKTAQWQRERAEALFEQGRIKKIPFMKYKLYMGSAYWKKRKLDYFTKYGCACEICGTEKAVTLHHKIYDDMLNGKEPDDHFAALCQFHHQMFHDNHSLKKNMKRATELFVKTMQQVQVSGADDLSWIK